MLRTLTTLIFCILTLNLLSQKYSYETSEKGFENPIHSLFYNGDGRFLDIGQKAFTTKKPQATFGDSELKNVRSFDFDFLDDKILVNAYFRANTLYLFATDKKESLYLFHVNPENFTLIGTPEKLFSFEENDTEYQYAYSEDSTYFGILCKHVRKRSSPKAFDGFIYSNNLSKKVNFSFAVDPGNGEVSHSNFLVSRSGAAGVISNIKDFEKGKKNWKDMYFLFTTITREGVASQQKLDNPIRGEIQKITWNLDKENFSFIGITGESDKKGYRTVVSGKYDLASPAIIVSSESKLPEGGKNTGQASSQDMADNGMLTDIYLRKMIPLKNGSALLIYDQAGVRVTRSNSSPTGNVASQKVSYTSYSGRTYVIKLNPAKEIEWFHAIQKQQLEKIELYLGIAFALDDNDGLHIFFHDHPANTETFSQKKIKDAPLGNIKNASLASVYITKDGVASKSFIHDNEEAKSFMMPATAYNLKNNEVSFIAYSMDKKEPVKFAKIVVGN